MQRHGICTVLQAVAGEGDRRRGNDCRIAQKEIAVRVGTVSVKVEAVAVRRVIAAVVEDEDQAVERYIARSAVIELDELEGVDAGRVSIGLVN